MLPMTTEPKSHPPYDLNRFITAQDAVLEQVMAELDAGRKRSHWMWFIFPQLKGLGHSGTAMHFGIVSLDEARAYLAHPVLGPRLAECTRAVLRHETLSLHVFLGSPDDLKFHSCMTLFAKAASNTSSHFARALMQFWDGAADPRTLHLLAEQM